MFVWREEEWKKEELYVNVEHSVLFVFRYQSTISLQQNVQYVLCFKCQCRDRPQVSEEDQTNFLLGDMVIAKRTSE